VKQRAKSYYLLTPVWGESYIQLYLEVVIPAQLGAGNLSAFSDNPSNRYVIFTRAADVEHIRASAVYAQLNTIIRVSIELIEEEIRVPHDTMSNCFRRGINEAQAADAAIIFLTPDLVFATGSFAALKRVCEQGADVVYTPGIRTLKQSVSSVLKTYAQDGRIAVPPRELMRIALDHLHPLADSSWWEEGDGDLVPANIYWRVRNEGLLGRCFHLHPLLVAPQRREPIFFGTVDDDFVPAACPNQTHDYIVTDSDELLAIELSDPARHFLTGFRKGSIDDVVTWAEQFTDSRHRSLFRRQLRLHVGIQNASLWAEAERKAAAVASAIENKLKRSSWSLFMRREMGLLSRRSLRRAQDQKLARANDFNESVLLEFKGWHLSINWGSVLLGFEAWLLRINLAAHHAFTGHHVRRLLYGPPTHPTPWTFRANYFRALRGDLEPVLRDEKSVLLLTCCEPHISQVNVILREHKIPTGIGSVKQTRDGLQIVRSDQDRLLPDASESLIIIERAMPKFEQLQDLKKELRRVLRRNGKIVIILSRSEKIDSYEELVVPKEAVAEFLDPEFNVLDQKTEGTLGSSLWLFVRNRSPLNVLRVLITSLVASPFSPLFYLLAAIDKKKRFYVTSVTVANRVGENEN
jgi:hypothetical protein